MAGCWAAFDHLPCGHNRSLHSTRVLHVHVDHEGVSLVSRTQLPHHIATSVAEKIGPAAAGPAGPPAMPMVDYAACLVGLGTGGTRYSYYLS